MINAAAPIVTERMLEMGIMRAGGMKRLLEKTSIEIAELLVQQQQWYSDNYVCFGEKERESTRTPVQTWKIEKGGRDFTAIPYGSPDYTEIMTPYTLAEIEMIAAEVRAYWKLLDQRAVSKLLQEA